MDQAPAVFGGTVADGYRSHLEPVIFRPWADRLVELAGVGPGEVVLDVAAGTGVVARASAARVGAGGQVIASDVSAAMLAHVPVGFPEGGVTLRTVECSATALEVPDGSVDVVLCQQGLPFIPDRLAAAREMRRVLRPGGRTAVAVWRSNPRIEPFIVYGEALQAQGLPEPFPGGYDSSGLTMSVEDVATMLATAGFEDVDVRVEHLELDWPSVDHAVQGIFGTPYGPVVDALDDATRQAVFSDLRQRMTGPDGRPARHRTTAVLGTGRRPA